MKRYLILIISFFLLSATTYAQIQATIKLGSQPNSVYITIRPVATITGAKFSTFQFALGIPSAVSTGITASVVSLDPLMGYLAPQVSNEMLGAASYRVFGFSGDGLQTGTGTNFTAGMEYNYAEVFFTGAIITLNDVRIMQIPAGGTTANVNFYVSDKGSDVTNQAAQFYSTIPANFSNDGAGYNGTSFATISPVVLPVKFTGFSVSKKENDAVLNWQVESESSITDRYEVERSVNGVLFQKIATVAPKNNGNSTNSYDLTDNNISSVNSNGILYYKIKQVDKDGKMIYSPIKNLRLNARPLTAGIYPNPVKGTANLSIDLEKDADAVITITDASGKQLQNISTTLLKGANLKKINTASLAAGSYLLKIQTATETKTISIVKSN